VQAYFQRVLKKGLWRREREAGVAKGAQSAPFATPASFSCAAAELQGGRYLAYDSTLSFHGTAQTRTETLTDATVEHRPRQLPPGDAVQQAGRMAIDLFRTLSLSRPVEPKPIVNADSRRCPQIEPGNQRLPASICVPRLGPRRWPPTRAAGRLSVGDSLLSRRGCLRPAAPAWPASAYSYLSASIGRRFAARQAGLPASRRSSLGSDYLLIPKGVYRTEVRCSPGGAACVPPFQLGQRLSTHT